VPLSEKIGSEKEGSIMNVTMRKKVGSNLHEFSRFMGAWSSVLTETEMKRAEFFLKMADSRISDGMYAEAIDIYNKLFENVPMNTSMLQRAKEMEGLLKIMGKDEQAAKWMEKFLNSAEEDRMSFSDIFPIEERRRSKRKGCVKPLTFYVTVLREERLERIYHSGSASVDISKEGVSMITDCRLVKGDVVFFEPEITECNIAGKSAIVRWLKEIQQNKYRAGLMFI